MNKRVLVIAPHADDEVLGPGGTIVKHVESNDIVNVVIVSNRSNKTHQRGYAEKAREKLGYKCIYWLDLEDEKLDISIRDIIKPLENVYNETLPDIVYTCHGGDVNIDHQAVFKASVVVCRPLQKKPPGQFLSYEVPSSTSQGRLTSFIPTVYSELTSNQLELKTDAFNQYVDEIRDLPNPRNEDGLVNYAIQRGMDCNSDFAESFMLLYSKL